MEGEVVLTKPASKKESLASSSGQEDDGLEGQEVSSRSAREQDAALNHQDGSFRLKSGLLRLPGQEGRRSRRLQDLPPELEL